MEIDLGVKPAKRDIKTPLFMMTGCGYSTRLETHFTREQPYQLVDNEEVVELLLTDRFRIATPEEILAFYNMQ